MTLRFPDDFIILVVSDPSREDADVDEVLISTSDIDSWDLPNILCSRTVQVRAHRSRLVQESSYFRGLFSGSFSESCFTHTSIKWNPTTFLDVLRCMYGCSLEITSRNFLPILEAAFYFGVEALLSKCRIWLSASALSNSPDMELDDLIHIWNFGLNHASDFVPDLCAAYLAKNFMSVKFNNLFGNIPYELLIRCINHPNLTVDSEIHLADAILVWLDSNRGLLESSKNQDDLIQQVHFTLLPLWFIAGKRKSLAFSNFADQSIELISKLTKMSSTSFIDILRDDCPVDFKFRLSEYSKRLDLSGCIQVNSVILLLSLLPNSYYTNIAWRKSLKSCLINLEHGEINRYRVNHKSLPIMSFENIQEIDISKCRCLDLKAVIEFLSISFPSLRTLRAAYLPKLNLTIILTIFWKFPELREIDLTVDVSPFVSDQTLSSLYVTSAINNMNYCSVSNITRLTLEGRSDIRDAELEHISRLCDSLQYLNIKGCRLVSDACIADVIERSKRLHSIIVCFTAFAEKSVLALTAKESLKSLASRLQILHMSGCKGVTEQLLIKLISSLTQEMKSLCLKDTYVSDSVLCNFSGSSLEMLDVSNTMISRTSLAHVISRNPRLKCLKARGCKHLVKVDSDRRSDALSDSCFGQDLVNGFDARCGLEELEISWGFSYSSLESMRTSITFLRTLSIGLGGSLGEDALKLLPSACPLLEALALHFQQISDSALTNVMTTLKHLKELALSYCLGDISMECFKFPIPNLRKLRLERVTRWMNNDDLRVLTQSYPNLSELSLIGCVLLNSDCQVIISAGWPGMISLHLEDCGGITETGVSPLFDCIALEDLLLRHNGSGIEKGFILSATSKLPMIRMISLDMCDARDGDYDIPEEKDESFLSVVKIGRCKCHRNGFGNGAPIHKETLLMTWNTKTLTKTLVDQRL